MATYRWGPRSRPAQVCNVGNHRLHVRRVRVGEYIAGIDGLILDKFPSMELAKKQILMEFERRFPPCHHIHYKILSERRSGLMRYKCDDCGYEWETDSSG